MTARRAIRRLLGAMGVTDDEWLAAALLVVSELVTNAVCHGEGRRVLDLHADGRMVTVGVSDGAPCFAQRGPGEPDAEGGRGLLLVESLSSCWGVQDRVDGKRVWAELTPIPYRLAGFRRTLVAGTRRTGYGSSAGSGAGTGPGTGVLEGPRRESESRPRGRIAILA